MVLIRVQYISKFLIRALFWIDRIMDNLNIQTVNQTAQLTYPRNYIITIGWESRTRRNVVELCWITNNLLFEVEKYFHPCPWNVIVLVGSIIILRFLPRGQVGLAYWIPIASYSFCFPNVGSNYYRCIQNEIRCCCDKKAFIMSRGLDNVCSDAVTDLSIFIFF